IAPLTSTEDVSTTLCAPGLVEFQLDRILRGAHQQTTSRCSTIATGLLQGLLSIVSVREHHDYLAYVAIRSFFHGIDSHDFPCLLIIRIRDCFQMYRSR